MDLVTAHKAHFEIVEREKKKLLRPSSSSLSSSSSFVRLSRLQFSILDDKDVTIVCKKLSISRSATVVGQKARCEKA